MSVPALRFPEFEGELTNSKIGDIAQVKTGARDTQDRVNDGAYPFFVRSDTIERINSYAFDGEAILTSGDGVGVGKNIHYINGKFDYHQRVYAIRNFNSSMDGQFFFQFFRENFLRRVMRLSAKNSVDSVRMSMITDMIVPTPTLPEQKKIAAFLGVVDEKLAALGARKAGLETYKRGLMQKLFSRTLRFTKPDGSPFPDWEEKKANELFRSVSNKDHSGELPILSVTQDRGAVLRDDVEIDIKATANSVLSYKVVNIGDFIISLRSFQGGIEYSKVRGICSPAYTILKPNFEIVDGFYSQYFKKQDFISRLSATVVGIRDGKQISYSAFSTMKLVYPSPEEQTLIANALQTLDAKIQTTADQITRMEAFKKGLLQQMFV